MISENTQETAKLNEHLYGVFWAIANILSESYLGAYPDYETLISAIKEANQIIKQFEENNRRTDIKEQEILYFAKRLKDKRKEINTLSEETETALESILNSIGIICNNVYKKDCLNDITLLCYKSGLRKTSYDMKKCRHCSNKFFVKRYNQEYCDECEFNHFGKEIIEETDEE